MASRKPYKKGIACIESFWDSNVERRLNVGPLLEIIASRNSSRFIHLTCNTQDELKFALKSIPAKAPFRILYFAFHGHPGTIELADGTSLSLDELATIMGRKFANWVIHFGTCGTIHTTPAVLRDFKRRTGAALLLGYTKNIDWVESAAMDLILFDWMLYSQKMGSMWSRVKDRYPGLVSLTGLAAFPSGRIGRQNG